MKSIIFILLFFASGVNGQNLIPNGSFDDPGRCPNSITILGSKIQVKDWYSPTSGTPDIFHTCSKDESNSIPHNFIGSSYPFNGDAYVGLCLYKLPEETYREYLAVRLSTPLEANEKYTFSFYFKRASLSKLRLDSLCVLFHQDSLFETHDRILSVFEPSRIIKVKSEEDQEYLVWQRYVTEITATGNEQFLYLGNFSDPNEGFTRAKPSKTLRPSVNETVAYYYFDGFELTAIQKEHFEKEKPFRLEKLFFAFDSDAINPEANDSLEALANYLLNNSDTRLLIKGYADKVGSAEYNEKLSLKRAASVKANLLLYGIDDGRISIEGFGDRFSTGINDDLDRRVEFLILN